MGRRELTAVLFDIDGTLVDMRGAGRKSFVRALKKVFGWDDDLSYVNFAGNTDLSVLQQVADHHGTLLTEAQKKAFFRQLPLELEQTVKEVDLVIYPGVRELLEELSVRPEVILGLVTGNIAECARIKLQQFNLHHHFILGAFGDDYASRADIARLAIRRIEDRLKPDQHIRACYLIGDTPHDVLAARAIQAISIAVATGKFGEEELRKAGADYVFTNLGNTSALLKIMGLS